jgi:hypothetical protein
MKRHIFFTAFIIALPLGATTTVQPVTEVSAQQAILRYRTTLPPSTACSWAITETVGGAVPDDVNPSIFANSNLDTRPGSLINGQDRAFVFGQRTTAQGLDRLNHSRSAKANTAYTATGTCSGDAPITVFFNTGNIQVGGTYVEQPPFLSTAFGNWGWPSINWTDQSKEYPDPLTGIVIKRATAPGWWGQQRPMQNVDYGIGSGWTGPQKINQGSGCAGNSTTCAETSGASPLFISLNGRSFADQYTPAWFTSGYNSSTTVDDVLLALTGKATTSTVLQVCLSYFDSGATCNTASHNITLTPSITTLGFPGVDTGSTGSTQHWSPQVQFGDWGGTPPLRADFGFAFGCVDQRGYAAGAPFYAAQFPTCPNAWGFNGVGITSTGTTVTVACTSGNNSHSCFNPKWNNSFFYYQGSGCSDGGVDICQVNGHPTDTQHLTLKNAPANPQSGTDLAFTTAGFTASSGTDLVEDSTNPLKVTSASHNFVAGDVGQCLNITGGPSWVGGPYAIASVSGNAAFLNLSYTPLSASGGVWNTTACAVTSATGLFGGTEAGDRLEITAGTNWTIGNYVIQYVNSSHVATLTSTPATGSSANSGTWNILATWNSLASGFVITPPGGNTATIDIGAQYGYAYSEMLQLLSEGDNQTCNAVPVSVGYEADGTTAINPPLSGELCLIAFQSTNNLSPVNGQLFLLIPSRGETRLLSTLYTSAGSDSGDSAGDQNSGQLTFPIGPFDGTCGTCFYGFGNSASNGAIIYKGVYQTSAHYKSYSHPLWAPSTAQPGQDPATHLRWSDDPIVYTCSTCASNGSSDIVSQMVAHNPTFDPAIWPAALGAYLKLDRVSKGAAVMIVFAHQDAPVSINFFNLASGVITGWGDTFFTYPLRLCGFHSSFQSQVAPGYYATSCNYPQGNNAGITLGGPFQSTPYSVYRGGTPSTDTSLTRTSPLEACSGFSGIPASIMAMITEAGVQNQCMHIRTKNIVSHTPSAVELAKWPSTQNPAWSEPTTLTPGDEIWIFNGENDLVAAVTTGVTDAQCSSDCLDVVVARGIPVGDPPFPAASGWAFQAGPTLGACQLGGCSPGVGTWTAMNAAGPITNTAILDPLIFGSHADGGAGLVSGNMSFVQSGAPYDLIRFNSPLASQAGTFTGANRVSPSSGFAGVAGCTTQQSYPSNEQFTAVSTQDRRAFFDFHHISPSLGSGAEQFVPVDTITYSLVPGTTATYKVTSPAGCLTPSEANYKLHGIQGWAGHNLLLDISGPSSSISDATPYSMCQALAAGECRAGSSIGDLFASIPFVPSILPYAITDWFAENYPSVYASASMTAGWLPQYDGGSSYALFENARRLTMGLGGYGRQYEFNTQIPETTGTWSMFKTDWADGVRSEIFMAKLPPFPSGGSVPRNTFVEYPVQVPAGPAYAEIRFGYTENGSAQAYYCTSRQDACTTSGSPFQYSSVDSRTVTSCSSGCTINIPAIAGRAVYYSIGSSANGSAWTYGAPQVGLVQ